MAGGAGRLAGVLTLAACAGGCFVDAIGGATTGDGQATTSSSTGVTSSAESGSGSSASTSTSNGGGGAGGSAEGGGGGCADKILSFDGSDSARIATEDANLGDDFSVGAWVFPTSGPSFMAGDGTSYFARIIDHADFDDDDGYLVGIGEPNDAGVPWASFVAFPGGVECAANAPIVFDAWVHIAGRYLDDVGGPDLFLLVDGAVVASANCGAAPPVDEYAGPVVLGMREEDGGQYFTGLLDDVFLKRGGNVNPLVPLACDQAFVFAYDFEAGPMSLCPGALELGLDAAPSDPELSCAD